MTKSIRTLAASAVLVALTIGPALAQNTKPATTTTTAKTETKSKSTSTSTTKHVAWTKDQIKAAQEGLAKGGYFKGTANGTWDKASSSAMKAWQKANKLPVTGHLTADELTKLSA
jgi:peptidoglycan hydrolase-like protein with peptidoglycan-binding domain